MTDYDKPEKGSHQEAGLIAAKLCFSLSNMMKKHMPYFEDNPERFQAWVAAIDEHLTVAKNGNYFDSVSVFDRFLMQAFVLDRAIFPRDVIQEFSDIRQGL